jgi:hypothetical protein
MDTLVRAAGQAKGFSAAMDDKNDGAPLQTILSDAKDLFVEVRQKRIPVLKRKARLRIIAA